ncbi:hypothetical protein [Actinophytocola sp. NPDC049390]|uniref:hypothetical protein n=1 Tax=Actinophytocola sp. NPDC049390 TaxID=3363894 RepID=UPI00378D0200
MKRLLPAVLSAGIVLAGCGSGGEVDQVTESEAYERVESYIQRAAAALPEARLEAAAAPVSGPCRGEPAGRAIVRTTYRVRGLTDADRPFDAMVRWWKTHDFEVLDDLRPERHYVWVESPADGFRMSLRDNEKDGLLLDAESPCVATQ